MTQALINVHAIWPYILLTVGGITVGAMLRGQWRDSAWRATDQWLAFLFVSAIDFEVIIGLLLWVGQGHYGGGESLWLWQHPLLMLLGWATARLGWFRLRRTPNDAGRFARGALYFTIAEVILLVGTLQLRWM